MVKENNRRLFTSCTWRQSAHSLVVLYLCVIILTFHSPAVAGKELCATCRSITEKVHEGIKKTSKSNFGGGNTRWEEESLGRYRFSETRLVEIMEDVCDSSNKECHQLVEEHEELMETWWFKEFAKGKDTDLYQFFCIDNVKVCCPSGTYGPECKECKGGRTRFCSGNGNCMGNGTREGTGDCSCNAGYRGDMCDECKDGYFEEVRNETHIVCTKCDNACKTSCYEGGPKGCDDCKEGWEFREDEGCFDIDECEIEDTCKEEEYCSNSPGSYKCQSCDTACQGCTGAGPSSCKECKDGFYQEDSTCKACHTSCKTSCTDGGPSSCDECKDGWMHTDDQGCIDVDECLTEPSPCNENQFCVNSEGSYHCPGCHSSCQGCTGEGTTQCKECKAGYQMTGNETKTCEDINECEDEKTCPAEEEKCVNKPGSYKCACKEGFERKGEACVKLEKVEKPKKGSKKSKVKKGKKKSKRGKKKAEKAPENGQESDSNNEENAPPAEAPPPPSSSGMPSPSTEAPPIPTDAPPIPTEVPPTQKAKDSGNSAENSEESKDEL